jgi:hypothetical protein
MLTYAEFPDVLSDSVTGSTHWRHQTRPPQCDGDNMDRADRHRQCREGIASQARPVDTICNHKSLIRKTKTSSPRDPETLRRMLDQATELKVAGSSPPRLA